MAQFQSPVQVHQARRRLCVTARLHLFNGKIKAQPLASSGQGRGTSEGGYYLYHKKNWIPVGARRIGSTTPANAGLTIDEFKRLKNGFDPDPNHRADHAKAHALQTP